MMLKKYNDNLKKKTPEKEKPLSSGVACDEIDCKGEMMIQQPEKTHPELPQLRRAICKKCGWRGWV